MNKTLSKLLTKRKCVQVTIYKYLIHSNNGLFWINISSFKHLKLWNENINIHL